MPIAKGDFVCEYAAKVISYSEGMRRNADLEKKRLFKSYLFFVTTGSKNICFDAETDVADINRLGRYVNHSQFNPNLKPVLMLYEGLPISISICRNSRHSASL